MISLFFFFEKKNTKRKESGFKKIKCNNFKQSFYQEVQKQKSAKHLLKSKEYIFNGS
jgi:hypothetical protein